MLIFAIVPPVIAVLRDTFSNYSTANGSISYQCNNPMNAKWASQEPHPYFITSFKRPFFITQFKRDAVSTAISSFHMIGNDRSTQSTNASS
jgi:hypothetical protein